MTVSLMTLCAFWGQTCVFISLSVCCPPQGLVHNKCSVNICWVSVWVSEWRKEGKKDVKINKLQRLDFDNLFSRCLCFQFRHFSENPSWCFWVFILLQVLVTSTKFTCWYIEKHIQNQGQRETCLHTRSFCLFCVSHPAPTGMNQAVLKGSSQVPLWYPSFATALYLWYLWYISFWTACKNNCLA